MKQFLTAEQTQQLTPQLTLSIGELIEKLPLIIDISDKKFFIVPAERIIAQNFIMYMYPNNSYGYQHLVRFDAHEELIDNLFDAYMWYLKLKAKIAI